MLEEFQLTLQLKHSKKKKKSPFLSKPPYHSLGNLNSEGVEWACSVSSKNLSPGRLQKPPALEQLNTTGLNDWLEVDTEYTPLCLPRKGYHFVGL